MVNRILRWFHRERVDRVTWYYYIESAQTNEEKLARWQELCGYLKRAKWT